MLDDTGVAGSSRIFCGLPPHGRGQRIGLYGGTFNPPHPGHRQVALTALRRLQLDQIWWLVTPGSPLKDNKQTPSLRERMLNVARLAASPHFVVTGIEEDYGTRFTIDLAQRLSDRDPETRFVWIMGADSLASFHHWHDWQRLAETLPIAIVNRPDNLMAPLVGRAAKALAKWRVPERDSASLADRRPPAWVYLVAPRSPLSSTELRAKADP